MYNDIQSLRAHPLLGKRFKGMSDSQVYSEAKRLGMDVDYNPSAERSIRLQEQYDRSVAKRTNPRPRPESNILDSAFDYLDFGIDENSAMWLQSAYVNSISGNMERWAAGGDRFDREAINEYMQNAPLWQDVLSMALGFAMPVDLITMGLSGGLTAAAKTTRMARLARVGAHKMAKKHLQTQGMRNIAKGSLSGAFNMGGQLAGYEGAMNFVSSRADGDDIGTSLKKLGHGVVHGGIMGAFAGGSGGGFGAAAAAKGVSVNKKWALKSAGFASEASVFSASELSHVAEQKGGWDEINMDDVTKAFVKNAALIGTLKGTFKVAGKVVKALKEDPIAKELRKAMEDDIDTGEKIIKTKDKINDKLDELEKDQDSSPELKRHISEVKKVIQSVDRSVTQQQKGRDSKLTFDEVLELATDHINDTKKFMTKKSLSEMSLSEARDLVTTTLTNLHDLQAVYGMVSKALNNIKSKRKISPEAEKAIGQRYEVTENVVKKLEKIESDISNQFEKLNNDSRQTKENRNTKNHDTKVEDTPENRNKFVNRLISLMTNDKDNKKMYNNRSGAKKQIERDFKDESGNWDFLALQEEIRVREGRYNKKGETTDGPDGMGEESYRYEKSFEDMVDSPDKKSPSEKKAIQITKGSNLKKQGLEGLDISDNVKDRTVLSIVRSFITNAVGDGGKEATKVNNALKVLAWVRKNRNKKNASFEDLTLSDIEAFKNHLQATDKGTRGVLEPRLTGINHVVQHASNMGYIKKMPWDIKQFREMYKHMSAEQGRKGRERTKFIIETKVKADDGKSRNIFNHVMHIVKTKFNPNNWKKLSPEDKLISLAARLQTKLGWGIRDQEINKLQYKDVNTTLVAGEKFIVLEMAGNAKAGTKPRTLVLEKTLGQQLLALKKGKKSSDLIFGEGFNQKVKKALFDKYDVDTKLGKDKSKTGAEETHANLKVDDLRRYIEDLYSNPKYKLSEIIENPIRVIQSLMGHGEAQMEVVYKGRHVGDALIDQVRIADRMGVDLGYKVERQVQSAGKAGKILTKDILKKQLDWVKEKFPHLTTNIVKNLGVKDGERVIGRIVGNVIDIVEGRAKKDTLPHEVAHHVIDVLRVMGDRKSKNIIKKGIDLVKEKGMNESQATEKLVQHLGEYVSKRITDKGMMAKTSNWVSTMWSHFKNKLGIANQADIVRILGADIYSNRSMITGLMRPQGMQFETRFQTAQRSEAYHRTRIRKDIRTLRKALFGSKAVSNAQWQQVLSYYGGKNITHIRNIKDRAVLESIHDALINIHADAGGVNVVRKQAAGWVKAYLGIKNAEKVIGLKPGELSEVLRMIAPETGGEISKASTHRLKQVNSWLRNYKETDISFIGDSVKSLMDQVQFKEISSSGSVLDIAKKAVYGAAQYIEKLGPVGKKISQKLYNHDWFMWGQRGIGQVHLRNIQNALKSEFGWREWKKIYKELGLAIDKERSKAREKLGIQSDIEKYIVKALNEKNPDAKQSAIQSAVKTHKEMTDYYWNQMYEIVREQKNISFERFEKDFGKKYVNDYISRRITPEASEVIQRWMQAAGGLKISALDKAVDKLAQKAAVVKASKKHKDVNSPEFKKEIEKILSDKSFIEDVKLEMANMLRFGPVKLKNTYLFKRGELLPEVIKFESGKKVQVYETSYENIMDGYVTGMSQYLASLKYFADFTEVGQKYGFKKVNQEAYVKLKTGNANAEYIDSIIRATIGLDSQLSGNKKLLKRSLGTFANYSAAFGLSSPTSGMKNLAIALPRVIGTFGVRNTFRSLKAAFDYNKHTHIESIGAKDFGVRGLELQNQKLFGGKLSTADYFKWGNLMTVTENIARFSSVFAGQSMAADFISTIRSRVRGEKTRSIFTNTAKTVTNSQIKRAFRDVWKLSEKEIKHLLEVKDFDPVKDATTRSIMQKIDHFSHVSTQGGTTAPMLPQFMSHWAGKPLTLFQRMAFVTTNDMVINYYRPFMQGNMAPLVRYLGANVASGAMLWSFYDNVLGMENPTSQKDSTWDKVFSYLWRAEFLGLATEVLNPYKEFGSEFNVGKAVQHPVILRNIGNAITEMNAVMNDTKDWKDAGLDFTSNTIVVFGQARRTLKFRDNPHYNTFRRLRTLSNTFKQDMGYDKSSPVDLPESKRQPFYNKLKDAFWFGTEEEMGEAYAKAYAYLYTIQDQQRIYDHKVKARNAEKTLKTVIKGLNPINFPSTLKASGRVETKWSEFYKYLDADMKKSANEVVGYYSKRLRQFDKKKAQYVFKYFPIYSNGKSFFKGGKNFSNEKLQ